MRVRAPKDARGLSLRLVSGANSEAQPLMLVPQHRTPLPEGQHIL